jgi:peptidoglycan/xylan/chitin deacetylase (PgdA/CDA1 family)
VNHDNLITEARAAIRVGRLLDPDRHISRWIDRCQALTDAIEERRQHDLANGGCVHGDAYRDLAEHIQRTLR